MPVYFFSSLALICVWSTTALAVKWSVTGIDYTAAVFLRFLLAFVVMLLIVAARRVALPPLTKAWRAWLIAGGSTALSMILTYWASQHISSGLVAVLHGLNPLFIALMVYFWQKQTIARNEVIGILLAIAGLATIFSNHLNLRSDGLPSLLAVLLAVLANGVSIIKLRAHSTEMDAYSVSVGSMGICALSSGVLWLVHGMPLPETLPLRATGAILYLALVGSVFALSLYFWMLRECRPTQISLLPMITTVSAVWLGHYLNGEVLTRDVLLGSGLIVAGLLLHQLGAWRSR